MKIKTNFTSDLINTELFNKYRSDGYLIIKNIISPDEALGFLAEIRGFADEDYAAIMNPDRLDFLIAQSYGSFEKFETLNQKIEYFRRCEKMTKRVWSIIENKNAVRVLEDLQQYKVSYLMSQMLFKEVNSRYASQAWNPHQDNSYPRNETVNSTNGLNTQYITTNFFLGNANKENGTLYVYPGSHKLGLLEADMKMSYREKNNNPGNHIFKETLAKLTKTDLTFELGDMLILNGNVIHGSYPNDSKVYSRPLLSVSYISTGFSFIPGKNAQRTEIPLNV